MLLTSLRFDLKKVCISIEEPWGNKRTSGSASIVDVNGCPGVSEYKAGFNLLQSINFVLRFHALRCQKSTGVNCSLLFTPGLFIIPWVVGDMFHYKKQFTGHSPKKKKSQFISVYDFLLSLVYPTPHIPTNVFMRLLLITRKEIFHL